MRIIFTLSTAVLAIAGCATQPVEPLTDDRSPTAAFAKGGGTSSTTIHVHLAWDDGYVVDEIPAGILGDGRQADGSEGTSEYQGGLCGVFAEFIGSSVEMSLYNATSCGVGRVHRFMLGGPQQPPHVVATKTIIRSLTSLAVGESSQSEFQGFHVGLPACTRVLYDSRYAAQEIGNPVRTRLADSPEGTRRWEVRSQGTHRAICVYTVRNKEVAGALTAPMPFRFIVTEVLTDSGGGDGGGDDGGEPCKPKGKSGSC